MSRASRPRPGDLHLTRRPRSSRSAGAARGPAPAASRTAWPAAPAAPPLARDPWAWAAALSALPLLLFSRGAPLGEPVADDYDYLRHMMFTHAPSWLDGGGSVLYWRPIARQLYYGLFSHALLASPLVVAVVHVVLLALAALVLYRTFRPRMEGLLAFSIASSPLLMESSRMLVAWPSNFQDLGVLLFVAIAMHEVSRGRMATFLAASLASFLCKEVGVPAAALALVCPAIAPRPLRRWLAWAASLAALVAAWGLLYRWVFAHAPLEMPGATEIELASRAVPWIARYSAIVLWALRAMVSLPPAVVRIDPIAAALLGLLALDAAWLLWRGGAAARTRLRAALPWALWGLAWFLPLAATLAPFYPGWGSYRCAFVGLGLGVAVTMTLAAIHPRLLLSLLVLRVGLMAVAPGAPARVTNVAEEWGASIDMPKLCRLQRFVIGARDELRARFPKLPARAIVAHQNFPRMSEYAFAGSFALQCWYRDSTLRWVGISEWRREPALEVTTVIEYQNDGVEPVALVEPASMRLLWRALDRMKAVDVPGALAALDSAASAQKDPRARVFRAAVEGKRALCLASVSRDSEAEAAALRARALNPHEPDAHYVLAVLRAGAGRLPEARAQLDTVLRISPGDADARRLLESLEGRGHAPGR